MPSKADDIRTGEIETVWYAVSSAEKAAPEVVAALERRRP